MLTPILAGEFLRCAARLQHHIWLPSGRMVTVLLCMLTPNVMALQPCLWMLAGAHDPAFRLDGDQAVHRSRP